MRNSPSYIERFDRYLRLEMNQEEREKLEKDLNDDNEMSTAFEMHKRSIVAIENHVLRNKMNTWHDQMDSAVKTDVKTPRIKSNLVKRYFIGAILLAIALLGAYYFFNLGNQSNTEHLYASHYYPDPGPPIQMSDAKDSNFIEGLQAYKNKNYVSALRIWNTLTDPTASSDTLTYFRASAQMASKKFPLALELFDSIPETSTFFEQSRWYMLLLHIHENNLTEARRVFQQLSELEPKLHREQLKEINRLLN